MDEFEALVRRPLMQGGDHVFDNAICWFVINDTFKRDCGFANIDARGKVFRRAGEAASEKKCITQTYRSDFRYGT
jgi:hypothetical protein